jgi:hypothetical protein
MKKIIIILFAAFFVDSCSVNGRVCGSSSGARCVEKAPKKDIQIPVKVNS